MKKYILICEIGPIYDFVTHSRKTIDFWSASFIFSYFMSKAANVISDNKGKIFRPWLEGDPLFTGKGKVTCGSVPDQIFALIDKDDKENIEKGLKEVVEKTINEIAKEVESINEIKKENVKINRREIKNFLNFFYIFHEREKEELDYKELLKAEEKIKMRSFLRPFSQISDSRYIPKWKKCSLCGDREKVYSKQVDKTAEEYYRKEHFCSVCILKRFLPKVIENLVKNIDKKPHYQSTSDIAAIPIKKRLEEFEKSSWNTDELKELKERYDNLRNEYIKEFIDSNIEDGRCFFETSLKKQPSDFRKSFKELKCNKNHVSLKWLERPFYSIVYMDGDNLGKTLKKESDDFSKKINDISKNLSTFSNNVNGIISKHNGQLIYAGGDDVAFIIHPEYLIGCLKELTDTYKILMEDVSESLTLSAGVAISYHKYPLSETIRVANNMLSENAKIFNLPNKNATAISLIKGHTEKFNFVFSNDNLESLKNLNDMLLKSDVSRTTPYRIYESLEILKNINKSYMENYLYSIIKGTRGASKEDEAIRGIVKILMKFEIPDAENMVNALLFARFLAGEK
ncbi:MAG: type III-B CRISPR-associated protein Cas10/Cmr2 [Candidatus Altiarchaeales archaeon WOR_SM1_79]|nr:MAG: type III-B CRISPR-associated protein Cas10/Cmr2 [Candidatus Altiarchaeales archaeon WOR_SM1_79]